MRLDDLLNLFLLSIPFWIPAVIGFYLVANRRNQLSLMAGLLTWKPILTTPLWLLIIGYLQSSPYGEALMPLYSILPGAGLTALALLIFRHLFFGPSSTAATMLIALDCLRWVNTGLLAVTGEIGPLVCIFALVGLIFPTAYAVVALTTTLATNEG